MKHGDGEDGSDVNFLQLEALVEAQEQHVPDDRIPLKRINGLIVRGDITYMTAHSVAPNIHWLYQYWYHDSFR